MIMLSVICLMSKENMNLNGRRKTRSLGEVLSERISLAGMYYIHTKPILEVIAHLIIYVYHL